MNSRAGAFKLPNESKCKPEDWPRHTRHIDHHHMVCTVQTHPCGTFTVLRDLFFTVSDLVMESSGCISSMSH